MLTRKSVLPAVLIIVAATSIVACLEVNDVDLDEEIIEEEGCISCHNGKMDLRSCTGCHAGHGDSPSHQKHMEARLWGKSVDCKDCHSIPDGWFEGDHFNATVDVVFSKDSLARTGGLEPAWNGVRCENVYCHGAGLTGGAYTEPAWQGENENGIFCGDCHGISPEYPHTEQKDCAGCHPSAYLDDGTLNLEVHLNGTVDF